MSEQLTSASVLSSRRRRGLIACTNCRHRKIKCVTTEEPPRRPCQRCTKRGLTCQYVPVDEEPQTDSKTPTPEHLKQSSMLPPPSPVGEYGTLPGYYAPNNGYGDYSPAYGIQSPSYPSYGEPAYPTQSLFTNQYYNHIPQDPYAQGLYQPVPTRCSCRSSPCYCGARRS
ncbi:C6 finger domain [Mycena indigotica]|uniref:C6 finger domain n=1 Tax=Mycena indigotica TaxID=2126181 RepID=A0A8H6W0U3_9AGAR|nr:C6 finger domain [Mycena indigotica]KAF7301349.1 C6 finger domain [Mycena indigotica]